MPWMRRLMTLFGLISLYSDNRGRLRLIFGAPKSLRRGKCYMPGSAETGCSGNRGMRSGNKSDGLYVVLTLSDDQLKLLNRTAFDKGIVPVPSSAAVCKSLDIDESEADDTEDDNEAVVKYKH